MSLERNTRLPVTGSTSRITLSPARCSARESPAAHEKTLIPSMTVKIRVTTVMGTPPPKENTESITPTVKTP